MHMHMHTCMVYAAAANLDPRSCTELRTANHTEGRGGELDNATSSAMTGEHNA